MLQGDSPEAFNDVEQPERVVPERKRITFKEGAVELPPHSLTIFRVPSPAAK
jgi:alpha-L-arabinofuranosidase